MEDRYLAIADYPQVIKTLAQKRHVDILNQRAYEVWLDSETLGEFQANAHLSPTRAKTLDKQFSSYSEHKLRKTERYQPITEDRLEEINKMDLSKLIF